MYSNNGTAGLEINNGSVGMNNLSITGNQVNSGNLTVSGNITPINMSQTIGQRIKMYPTGDYGFGITSSGAIMMYGDSGGNVSLGTSGFTNYIEILKCNKSDKSVLIPSGDLNVLKNSTISGNMTV